MAKGKRREGRTGGLLRGGCGVKNFGEGCLFRGPQIYGWKKGGEGCGNFI